VASAIAGSAVGLVNALIVDFVLLLTRFRQP